MAKLPVFSTIKAIYKETFGNPLNYVTQSAIWLGLIAIISYFGYGLTLKALEADFYAMIGQVTPDYTMTKVKLYSYTFAINVIGMFFMSYFTRSAMINKHGIDFNLKNLSFAGKYILISIIGILVFALVVFGFSLLISLMQNPSFKTLLIQIISMMVIALVIAMYFVFRLIAWLADGFNPDHVGFKRSWKMTKGNVARMWAIFIAVALPSILIFASYFISYSNPETGVQFNVAAFLFENEIYYVARIVIISLFIPLYGTAFAKIYQTLNVNDNVYAGSVSAPIDDKKTESNEADNKINEKE